MELFDKKYVHFMWEDELEGKEGFVSQNIKILIDIVNSNCTTALKPLSKELVNQWTFVYYDQNYECKRAYAEGKQLQWRGGSITEWTDYTLGEFDEGFEYRIKPEESKTRRMTYRQRSEWLSKGNGQCKLKNYSHLISYVSYSEGADDEECDDCLLRRWGSDEWIEPNYDVYLKDCKPYIEVTKENSPFVKGL